MFQQENTTSQYFGPGVDTTKFTIDYLSTQGRCCQGKKSTKCFGYIRSGMKIPTSELVFCEFCAKNYFEEGETYEEIDSSLINKSCKIAHKPLVERYGISNRNTYYGEVQVNVNVVNPSDEEFVAACKIPGEKGREASKHGAHICLLPSQCYYEIGVGISSTSRYAGSTFYYKVNAKTKDGRVIKIADQRGNTNFYMPSSKRMYINSFESGSSGKRFFFVTPSQLEKDHGMEASHNEESNIIYISVDIFERIPYEEPETIQYRGYTSKGGGQMRGGTTRGYNKGATFEAEGTSSAAKTTETKDTFRSITSTEITVQLVNNESETTLVDQARAIQEQVSQRVQYRTAVLLKGHKEQASQLL